MTLECCNRMAAELLSSKSMLDEAVAEYKSKYPNSGDELGKIPNVPYGTNGRTATATYPKNIFFVSDSVVWFNSPKSGFGTQYSIPRSKTTDLSDYYIRDLGYKESDIEELRARNVIDMHKVFPGLYPTRMDMNFLFGVGQDYGKQKIIGMQSRCSYYLVDTRTGVTRKLYGSPYGYSVNNSTPPGAVMRDVDGQRMIKATTGAWKEYKATRSITYEGDNGDIVDYGSDNASSTAFRKKLASVYFNETNGIFLVGEIIGNGETVSFTNNLIGYLNLKDKGDNRQRFDLCYGESVLKLSKYNDLETNSEHSNEYIEIIRSTSRGFGPQPRGKAIPLKKGVSYFLYLEFKNRPVAEPYTVPKEANIAVYKTTRKLYWPDVNPS